jgi:hypothetical protein
MTIRKQNMPFPNASSRTDATQEIEGSQRIYRPIPSPEDILQFGLVGIPKYFPLTGEPITREYVARHLEEAIQDLLLRGLCLYQRITTQVEDMYENDLINRFQPFKLNCFPVLSIESIQLMYPNSITDNPYATYTLPPEWYMFEKTRVNMVATSGTILPSFSGHQGLNPIPFTIYGSSPYRPSVWKVTYLCGFENDLVPTFVWSLVIDKTVLSILNEVGPLLFSVNNYTVGIDGVQQSANLPGPRLFDARLQSLQKKITKSTNLCFSYFGCRVQTQYAGR